MVLLCLTLSTAAGFFIYQQYLITNFATVVENKLYRSAQPQPEQLEQWQAAYGINSIINLRGVNDEAYYQEELAAAERLGINLHSIKFSAQSLPPVHSLKKLFNALETLEPPILLHCRAGADRSGVASVIGAMILGEKPYEAALAQVSIKYLQLDRRSNNMVGVFALYEEWCQNNNLSTSGYQQFKNWVIDSYHRAYYRVCISSPEELTLKPGEQIQTAITIENCSSKAIPAADPNRIFTLAAFTGSSIEESPEAEFAPRIALPAKNIEPGQSITINQTLTAPVQPGVYQLHHDLIEENVTWFARQGSPVPTCQLTVLN